ncbi:hypothetical protein LCI18_002441 [Fusarium solani-melongenae]|uniref:Uncharacterized protein n=1 Tax=Fusarium solani subsp. cucurbitae TaxID=2747967 RepID=A0ACD3YSB8_FUSSC|nr:hypothetical protein LCI18_002441 [Fusarium solani-melongenae]
MPPGLWPMLKALIDSDSKDEEPFRTLLTNWLTQQSGHPFVAPRYHRINYSSKATLGTGAWILATEEFRKWKDDSSPHHLLFMQGILGSGKSTLVSIIIGHLEKEYQKKQDIICVYLFLREGDSKAPSAVAIWTNLIIQLLQRQGPRGIAEDLRLEFDECEKDSSALHPSKYFNLFKAQAQTFRTVYLVIDGLDNCPNVREDSTQQLVLNTMKDLPSNVRSLLTSRTELPIHHLETSRILVVTSQRSDIEAYVKSRIENDAGLHRILIQNKNSDWFVKSVTDRASASGMFLLARLHLDTLSKQDTVAAIEKALFELPDNLKEAFEGAIKEITKKGGLRRERANHVLTWIVHAKADLTIEQIQDSFMFHKSKEDSRQHSRPQPHLLVPDCAGLVVEDRENGTLRLVHESVKRYLKGGDITYKDADLEIAKTCLSCLLAESSSHQSKKTLFKYASHHWASHFLESKRSDDELDARIHKFFRSGKKLARAFEAMKDTHFPKVEGMTGLHAAVFHNLRAQAERLIEDGIDINARCSDGQTALHWAVTLGRDEFVELLNQNSADTNIRDAAGNTPIHKYLTGLDMEGAKGLTPLSLAIRYGPTSVAKLLISSQKDVNDEVIMPGWTSLRELFYHGHDMRLLKKGADLNRPTADKWLPLIHAVKYGPAKTLQLLLDRSSNPADINLRDPESGMSPLCLAFQYDQRQIARLLIESGCDLNERNDDGWTPLIEAVQRNDADLVWLMLNKKAKPNRYDKEGWSALHYAIKAKNRDIVWLLVTKGARVKSHAEGAPAFLDLALSVNDLDIAWLLHEHRADINSRDGLGMTALHKACREGNLRHVRFLLQMGSKIDYQDKTMSTPLHYAVIQEQEEIVDLVASRTPGLGGLNDRDHLHNTALVLATILRKRKMVESLLRNGASCDVPDEEDGLTALHRAANLGFNDILRLLVAKTGNIDLADKKRYTALHHAVNSEAANAGTIEILCSTGADLRKRQKDEYWPWMLAYVLGRKDFAQQLAAYAVITSRMQRGG